MKTRHTTFKALHRDLSKVRGELKIAFARAETRLEESSTMAALNGVDHALTYLAVAEAETKPVPS